MVKRNHQQGKQEVKFDGHFYESDMNTVPLPLKTFLVEASEIELSHYSNSFFQDVQH